MKNRLGIIILILICVGLSVGLIWSQKKADDRRTADADRIDYFSNKIVETEEDLMSARKVTADLESYSAKKSEEIRQLTNLHAQVTENLKKTQAALKATEEEMSRQVAQRDTRISELENQNEALDQRALDLGTSITNLTAQIADTRQRLAASEGDKAFLERELQRLMAEKAELERQFNDLEVLRTQVAKLKQELNISRRLDWIRKGLFAGTERKGAEQLMNMSAASLSPPPPKPSYDLNVEVSADGTVRVIPPLTNAPAGQPPSTP